VGHVARMGEKFCLILYDNIKQNPSYCTIIRNHLGAFSAAVWTGKCFYTLLYSQERKRA